MKLTILCFLTMFSLVTAQITTNSDSLEKDIGDLFELLISVSSQGDPWTQSKEIASWAATVLFLTIIGLLISNYKKFKRPKFVACLFFSYGSLLLLLFCHFVNQQFGSVADDAAMRSVYIYKLVQLKDAKEEVPYPQKDIFKIDSSNTMKVDTLHKMAIDDIRSRGFFRRLFLPFHHIRLRLIAATKNENWNDSLSGYWKGNKPSSTEIEEVILYNIMLITYICFSIVLLLQCNLIKTPFVKIWIFLKRLLPSH